MRLQVHSRMAALALVVGALGVTVVIHDVPWRGAAVVPAVSSHADLTATALCVTASPGRRVRSSGVTISVACARSDQGYPIALGREYIAVSPASAPPGTVLRVWGSCGCGDSTSTAPGMPVETARLWLLGVGRQALTWHGQRVVVNAGRTLLGEARIDSHANWSAQVMLPWWMAAGFGLSGRSATVAGRYSILVTYPGEQAGAQYYAVASQEGYITPFDVTHIRM